MDDRLRKFIRLVDAGSFTKAAKELHISQPALSITIQKLEKELRAELLLRQSKSLKLTAAGKLTYQAAKAIGMAASNLKQNLNQLAGQKPEFFIGLIDSAADALFVHGNSFETLGERAKISLSVNDSTHLLRALNRDEIDIAILVKPPTPLSPTLEETQISTEPLVAVTHPQNYKAIKRNASAGNLNNFLSYNQNSTTYKLISTHLRQNNIQASAIFYSTSPEIMLQLVLAKKGVAILPFLMVKEYIRSGQLAPIKLGKTFVVDRPISLVKHKGQLLDPTLVDLANQLKAVYKKLASDIASI